MAPRSKLLLAPNALSVLRIGLIPILLLIYIFSDTHQWIAGILFAIASLTDWLDGFLARKFRATTKFGAFIDPVADKLAVVSALVVLIGLHGSLWLTLPGVVIVCRELLITSLREWMAGMNLRSAVAVNRVAKFKTFIQMSAICILLSNQPMLNRPWAIVGLVLLYVATVLTLWSAAILLRAAWPVLRSGFFSE